MSVLVLCLDFASLLLAERLWSSSEENPIYRSGFPASYPFQDYSVLLNTSPAHPLLCRMARVALLRETLNRVSLSHHRTVAYTH